MRILVDILHPNQAHFFRPLIAEWIARGDVVQIVTRDKDITHELLDSFGFAYVCLSRQRRGLAMVWELLHRWSKMFGWIGRFKPDIVMSVSGISTALPSWLKRTPNLAFTDTETARLSNRISFPFATRVLTPEWFTVDFGKRHRRYRGFHEWSYLNPAVFEPDPDLVRDAGLDPDERYAVVRFVRWDAVHDRGESGLAPDQAVRLITQLSEKVRVHVSSEAAPPPEIEPFVARIAVDRMHQVLAHASLVVGESPSMATEAALLGVPSVLVSSWAGECGNMQVLESQGLMQVFSDGDPAIVAAAAIADEVDTSRSLAAVRGFTGTLEPIAEFVDRQLEDLLGAL